MDHRSLREIFQDNISLLVMALVIIGVAAFGVVVAFLIL